MRNTFLVTLILLLGLSVSAQRSPEDIGKALFESIRTKNFEMLHQLAPTSEVIQMLREEQGDEGSAEKHEEVSEKIKEKMKAEFDDMLKSAKYEHVKVKKLTFDKIIEMNDNEEAPIPMKAVTMQMTYKGKPVQLSYVVVEAYDNWYYIGTLLSMGIFQQVRE